MEAVVADFILPPIHPFKTKALLVQRIKQNFTFVLEQY
jgi:hypothetical protein